MHKSNVILCAAVIVTIICCVTVSLAATISRVTRSSSSAVSEQNGTDSISKRAHFRMAVVADLDGKSRVLGGNNGHHAEWISYIQTATIHFEFNVSGSPNVTIDVEEKPQRLKGFITSNNRGQELSELIWFADRLLTCDDHTGIIYQMVQETSDEGNKKWRQVPWVILAAGDGTLSRGFKCEWATVKNNNLWIGSHGTTRVRQFVKEITTKGEVTTHDWAEKYEKIKKAVDVGPAGFIKHEAVGWSEYDKSWLFIPRFIVGKYNDSDAGRILSKKMIFSSEDFTSLQVREFDGHLNPNHGFSSFKWIPLPGSNSSYIVALAAEETVNAQSSYFLVFDAEGQILLPELKIADLKYEGLEFI